MAPSAIVRTDHLRWDAQVSPAQASDAVTALERGDVLFFPKLAFTVSDQDASVFSPDILNSSKNASFDPSSGRVGGTTLTGGELERLRRVMSQFSDAAALLVDRMLPHYHGQVARARSSFRPAEIAGRATSWRKDDTRLHVDSFPASPVQGRRILRVFTNVNPAGRARSWRIGEGFDEMARRFSDSLTMPRPGSASLLRLFRVTKTSRSAYDSMMLQLHDRMKRDTAYQQTSPQTAVDFPSGTTWMAFTDQVSHAAMAGQYQFEQTFLLPIEAMVAARQSPLRILEGLKGRRLV